MKGRYVYLSEKRSAPIKRKVEQKQFSEGDGVMTPVVQDGEFAESRGKSTNELTITKSRRWRHLFSRLETNCATECLAHPYMLPKIR